MDYVYSRVINQDEWITVFITEGDEAVVNSIIDSLINDYIDVVSQYDYTLGYKTKKIYKQLNELIDRIPRLNSNELKYFLDNVLSHESLSVQLGAAAIAIENQYRTDEAKKIILKIRELNVREAKSYAPLSALPAMTEYLFDDRYPYISNIFHQTSFLMKKSIMKDSIDIKKRKEVIEIVSKQKKQLIHIYIDFLNNRKHDGCFMYYGAVLAFRYNYHVEEAEKNMIMISKNSDNWGRVSNYSTCLLDEYRSI